MLAIFILYNSTEFYGTHYLDINLKKKTLRGSQDMFSYFSNGECLTAIFDGQFA